MSEFSPDTIQFKASPPPSNFQSSPQSTPYQELSHWLSNTQHPVWQQWLKAQMQEEALTALSAPFSLPLHLNTLQDQLRILHSQMTSTLAQTDILRQLLYNWQKQTEALTLGNKAAYAKAYEERQGLSQELAETEWPSSFLSHCHQIEHFLVQEAHTGFKFEAPLLGNEEFKPPKRSMRLKAQRSGFSLPSGLQTSIFQRTPSTWLRRSTRYLQMAWKEGFNDKKTLRKLLKSLYAALEQEPDYSPALLLLGWIFACMDESAAAMACLERLRQQKSHPEIIFLIKFLQNRPLI